MTRLLKTLVGGARVAIGISVAIAGFAQQGHVPSPQNPSTTPGMQQGDMMKMTPQMNQMMGDCVRMMKSPMQQPAGPSPQPNAEQKG
jgi:hypothetical protein